MGAVIFHDRGEHRRFLAEHNAVGDKRRRSVHYISITGNARQRLFNPFHFTDRDFELAANMGVSPGSHSHRFQAAGGVGRQSNTAAHRQTFNQHAPALTGHPRPTNDVIDRHEDIFAAGWAVLERDVKREVATANFHARGGGRDQRAGDAQLFFSPQQTIRVRKFKRQSQHGGDRRQRNVAFVPCQAHTQHLLALPVTHADHAGIRNGAGVRARFRASESEAGDLLPARQTRQIMVFLLFGTVMLQQLARPQ